MKGGEWEAAMTRPRILIVEDDLPARRQVMAKLSRGRGWEIRDVGT
jgi:hypothetical protein